MFSTKYLLLAVIALFYRASLLDFAKESSLVSRQLFSWVPESLAQNARTPVSTQILSIVSAGATGLGC